MRAKDLMDPNSFNPPKSFNECVSRLPIRLIAGIHRIRTGWHQ
jgi:hypothetical protein